MRIETDFNLKKYSSMKCGPEKATLIHIESPSDILPALEYAKESPQLNPAPQEFASGKLFNGASKKLIVIGETTNTVFEETAVDKNIFCISDIKTFETGGESCVLGGGLSWDKAVEKIVESGYSGLEALSGIPGTVGAGPVQNIGAYGTEIKDSLISVEAYDFEQEKQITLTNNECSFSYRDSIFKQNPGKYFIISVTLKISKAPPKIPDYKDVKTYFMEKNIPEPGAQEIRNAILEIRARKLPNYKTTPNLGSYFKNPIINSALAKKLLAQFPNIPQYPYGVDVKVSAGWLIEQVGLKGFQGENFGVYEKNALVLVNNNAGTSKDLLSLENKIKEKVFEVFGIELEREPILVK